MMWNIYIYILKILYTVIAIANQETMIRDGEEVMTLGNIASTGFIMVLVKWGNVRRYGRYTSLGSSLHMKPCNIIASLPTPFPSHMYSA